MRRALIAFAAALALLVAAPAARAASMYCSPSGDYCKATAKQGGKRFIELRTAALYATGRRYRLCVEPPRDDETCHTFRLREGRFGIYVSRVSWSAHFPTDGGSGIYRIRWDHRGLTYGPALTFRR